MTTQALSELLIQLHSMKGQGKRSHAIIINFECPVSDEEDVARFVDKVQAVLDTHHDGVLDIYGIDNDLSAGEFLIDCGEKTNIDEIFERIRPIMDNYTFFAYSYAVLHVPDEKGGYTTHIEPVREERVPEDTDPELPVPEGIVWTKPTGCLGLIALLLSLGSILALAAIIFLSA